MSSAICSASAIMSPRSAATSASASRGELSTVSSRLAASPRCSVRTEVPKPSQSLAMLGVSEPPNRSNA